MTNVVALHSGGAFGSFCTCVFLCSETTVWVLVSSGPLLGGSSVVSSCCIYVTGLIQAVVFYLRVVMLCSVVLACSGLVRVFSGFASLSGVIL